MQASRSRRGPWGCKRVGLIHWGKGGGGMPPMGHNSALLCPMSKAFDGTFSRSEALGMELDNSLH